MGTELISMCVFGPKKLSLSKVTLKKAEKCVREYAEAADELATLEEQILSDDREIYDRADLRIKELLEKHGIECVHDSTWACRYKDDPMKFVNEFIDVWHNYSSDSAGREVPGQRNRKVWYAGTETCGDDPDGFGYQTMKRADACGLLNVFGME